MKITRHFLDVAGRRVHYRKAGSGPPLLMAHQSPRSSAEYEPLMMRWAEHFTCIAPDTPGFGQSTRLPGEPSIDDFADAFVEFLDAAGLAKVGAYGFHSGGIILVTALKRHPERFSALAIGGYAVWTEEERRIFGASYLPPFRPSAYGEHLVWLWNRILEQTWFFPWFDVRNETRLKIAHDDPARTDAAIREMLDSGDAYRAGYGAVLGGPRDIPEEGADATPVLVTAYDGDPLQAHLQRLGTLPSNWSAHAVPTPAAHQEASLAFLRAHPAPEAGAVRQAGDKGFVAVAAEDFDGLIHWRGDRSAGRVLLHAPGGSVELLADPQGLLIDLPGHGLSDDFDGRDIAAWANLVAAAVRAVSRAEAPTIVGEGMSALLALAVARELGAPAVEGLDAHLPLPGDAGDWIDRQPDLLPGRFGSYLTEAWGLVRASRFYWPWFRAAPAYAIPFDAAEVTPESLALGHRSLIRARGAKALIRALLKADRAALLAEAPAVAAWTLADWARVRADIWRPDFDTGERHGNT